MTIPTGVVPASVAMVAPLMITSRRSSWNKMPDSVRACKQWGRRGPQWGYSVVLPPKCSRRCLFRAGPTLTAAHVGHRGPCTGPLVGVPRALVGQAPGWVVKSATASARSSICGSGSWAAAMVSTVCRAWDPHSQYRCPGSSVVWCGVVWCGVVWCGVVWCGVVWCGVSEQQQLQIGEK